MMIIKSILIIISIICINQVFSISPQYGVGPEELQYYKEGKYFDCLRSNTQIPFSQVNDDFCDCIDGTDEPGTSACSNGHFYCKNIGHKGKYISSSYVNDGVCDCCDGSDEYQSKITCENTCKKTGEESRRKQNEIIESYENGLKIKKEMEEEGTKTFNDKSQEIIRLRKEIDPITQEIKELEVLIEKKKSDKEIENKRLQEEEERKDKEEEEQQEQQQQQQVEQQKQQQEEQQGENTENKENVIEKPKEEKVAPTSELLEGIIKDIEELENQISGKRESLKNKENEIEKIEKMLNSNLGVNNVFLPLYNKCFDLVTKEYTYSVCPFDKASQGHTSLGKFEKFIDDGKTMLFENGQQCWGGPKRSIKVYLECGHTNELHDVQEPGKCEYTIKFKTPAMCTEEHLKVLKLENDHVL